MSSMFEKLQNCILFKGFNKLQIQSVLENSDYRTMKFSKEEIIALEGEVIKELGIVLEGEVNVKKIHETGKILQVKKLYNGDLIGNASVFSDFNYYPSTVIAEVESNVLFISQKSIIDMCMSNKQLFINFVKSLSNQVAYLSEKVRFISCGTIRKKIINYLLSEYKKQKTLKIKVSVTRKKMSEIFGVTRPALSNEMIMMKKEGFIKYKDDIIEIIDIYKLEEELEK